MKILPFFVLIPSFLLASLPILHGSASILVEDDFESYADEAALNAVWLKVGNAITHLAVDPADPQNQVLFSKGDRRTHSFPKITPKDDEPVRLQVDYYDDYQEGVPGREYIGLWAGSSDSSSLIEIGLHNNAPEHSKEHYTARIFGSEHGSSWFDLSTIRSKGWHRFELLIFETNLEIYIDNELDSVVEWSGGLFGAVRLGFGAGSGETASLTGIYYDNLKIEKLEAIGGQGTLIELSHFQNP